MSIENFKNRLKEVIGDGRNVSTFAKKCGFAEGSLRSYLKGDSLPGLDKLVKIAEVAQVSIEWLAIGKETISRAQPVVSADPAPLYLTEISPERKKKAKLGNMLNRIIDEGDSKKIKAVESQLDLLDPGEKKQNHAHENDGSGGYMGGLVA